MASQSEKRLVGPLARARGLGSAKKGLQHWWAQRVTAVALVPLTLWFVFSVIHLNGADQAAVHDWLRRPASAIMMSLLLVATFYHLALGAQVVIEDYVHREGVKLTSLLLVKGLIVLLAASALFTVLRVAVGG
jgi:succinate dehydrogenase / fumarate reductase membrane anchor subunit